ncbi:MAG: type II secretion system F family protein [Alphaproteobacteria bacterium]
MNDPLDLGWLKYLVDSQFMVMAFTAIAAFATIVTLAFPYLRRDTLGARMKYVAERREELRARQREALNDRTRRGLRAPTAHSFVRGTVENLRLQKLLESPGIKEKLARAGKRGQRPFITFLFFRFLMPPIVFVGALMYLYGVSGLEWPFFVKLAAAIGAALVGYYLPDLYITNVIQRRQASIMQAFPDALDLMLICVESGMSIESAFGRVASEVGPRSVELAEELGLTTAEMAYLPERRQAFENLASRTGHPGVKAVAAALIQSEKYGTPMGQALRVTAQENREMRMAEAERRAHSLPAKLTVPMIVFFLPCLFVVILGPAIIKTLGVV